MTRSLVVTSLLLGLTGAALGNGRAPGTSTIHFQPGNESHILAGMTFGVLKSTDNGATWQWQCEEAVGYGGMFDPDYTYTPSGELFATTFDGLKVSTNGCEYDPSTLAPGAPAIKFFSAVTTGPDGAVYAAAADPTDDKIYKSTDGVTFNAGTEPGQLNDWWQSLEVAPSNAQVVYLTGYRFEGQTKTFLLFKSTNGGTSFSPMPGNAGTAPSVNGIAVMANSTIEIAAISKTNPNLVYARVTLADNAISDAIYRSTDGGQSWTKIFEKQGSVAFLARANGDLVAGTQVLGSFKAADPGAGTPSNQIAFAQLAGAPHINCLAENAAGEVWACTQNYGSPQVPSDDFGIMKSTNLTSWTGVIKFQDVAAPDACAVGTPQHDRCDAVLWCGLCQQLGCNPNRECAGFGDGAPTGDTTQVKTSPGGCCQTGDGAVPGLLALGLLVGMVVMRRRHRRR